MSTIEKQIRELALALPVMAPHTSLYTLPVETLLKICQSWLDMQKAAQMPMPTEQTGDTNSPNLETGTGRSAKRE